MLWFLFIFIRSRGRGQSAEAIPWLTSSTHKHGNKTSNMMQLMTLDMTRVAPSKYGIQRGSDYPLRAPCQNPRSWRWRTRCSCRMRRGHWLDNLPSSCSLGWWRLSSVAGCGESQSRAEQPIGGCSAPPSHPGGTPSPSWGHPGDEVL
jgi:hypothetical protein